MPRMLQISVPQPGIQLGLLQWEIDHQSIRNINMKKQAEDQLHGGLLAPGWPAAVVKESAFCSWESSNISSSLLWTHFPTTSAEPLPQPPDTDGPTPDGPWKFKRSLCNSSGTARALSMSSSYAERLKGMSLLIRAWKTWSTGGGNGKPLQYSCLENTMSSMKRQKDITLKAEPPRSVAGQYTIGEDRKIAPERMKRLSQSGNDTQVWLYLVVKAKFNAVKNNIG